MVKNFNAGSVPVYATFGPSPDGDEPGRRRPRRGRDLRRRSPSEFTILKGTAAIPNPFASETRLAFSLPKGGPARVAVYDVQGRRVRTLLEGNIFEGEHDVTWTGTDLRDRPVARGIHFAVLEFEGERRVRKLTVTR